MSLNKRENMKVIFNKLSKKNKDKIILIAKSVEKADKLKEKLKRENF